MAITVRPRISRSSALRTASSDSPSSAEVASSSSSSGASFRNARAMAMRWRWPPESFDAAVADDRLEAVRQLRDELVASRGDRRLHHLLRRTRPAGRSGCSP